MIRFLLILMLISCFGLDVLSLGWVLPSNLTGFFVPLNPANPRERLTSGASDELNCNGHLPGSQSLPEEELDEIKQQMQLKQEDQRNANVGSSWDMPQSPYEYCNGLYSPDPGQSHSNGDVREEGEDDKLQERPLPSRDKESTLQNGQPAAHLIDIFSCSCFKLITNLCIHFVSMYISSFYLEL